MLGVRRAALAALCLACCTTRALAAGGQCTQPLPPDAPALDDTGNGIQLDADRADLVRDGLSTLSGGVSVSDGQRAFSAEELRFDSSRSLVDIDTRSQYRERSLYVASERMRFDIGAGSGRFEDSRIILQEIRARAGAEVMTLSESGTAELTGVRYTTCGPDSEAWALHASEIALDRASGLGTARNARLHVLGVPVLYVPWLQFPLDDQRRTGLLYPRIGTSSRNGFDLTWPVYVNLAPNYDLRIDPRWLSRRGLQMGSTFRYLGESQEGSLRYEYLANDQRVDDDRAFGELSHRALLNDRLSVATDYAEVSDTAYFDDLGSDFDRSALTFLPRQLRMAYTAPSAYTASLRVSSYQVLDPSLLTTERPYRRLPQLRVEAVTPGSLFYTRAGLSSEYVAFDGDNVVEGQRFHLNPYIRSNIDRNGWFASARADWQYTGYDLSEQAAGQPSDPSRSLPSFSAEGGLRFERLTDGGNLQTLEPRALYLYTPFRAQDDIPIFDSGEPDFGIVQLFSRNRYTGLDRIADANHVAGALTSRLLDSDTGAVRWSATVGQLLRFDRSRVALDGAGTAGSGVTDFIASFDYNLSRRVTASVSSLWSPDDERFNRTLTRIAYRDGQRQASVGYRYRRDQLEQTDIAAGWPLGGGFSAIGRWRRSLRAHQTLEALAGVAYESCCWIGRLTYRRYIASTDGEYESGVMLQFELRGLGGLGGSGSRSLLERGY
ncbi:LPS assembly protein LptD [Algiphilus sp.]|uniref:LPS-assembly protein LptD n=3 Tax=Algiphilus sp. TaxID=1872431 RepID=UPI0025C0EF84|nr:LPS assembly protein LptD [Algiphilus sp.]MCK5768768.1 LPS assembly protein LptD [Algiphilus sp.]